MSSQTNESTPVLTASIPGLAIIAVLLAGVLATQSTSTSTTKSDTDKKKTVESLQPNVASLAFVGKVPLWQDPFFAVNPFQGVCESCGTDYLQALRQQVQRTGNSKPNLRIMFVSTSSEMSPDAAETRIRSRQAVVGSLRAEGFTLEHSDQIYYVPYSSTKKASEKSRSSETDSKKKLENYKLPLRTKAFIHRSLVTPVSFRKADATEAPQTQSPSDQPNVGAETPSRTNRNDTETGNSPLTSTVVESPEVDSNLTLACELFSDDSVARQAGWRNSLDYVLVVWIPEEILAMDGERFVGLQKLIRFFEWGLSEDFHTKHDESPEDIVESLSFRLVGPFNSGTLSQLFRSAEEMKSELSQKPLSELRIYSPSASAEAFLLRTEPKPPSPQSGLQLYSSLGTLEARMLTQGSMSLMRTCSTDDEIACALVEELQTRGLNIVPSSADSSVSLSNDDGRKLDNIALICEHETLYGRGFAQTLNAVLWHRAVGDGRPYHERDEVWRQRHAACPNNVHLYYYPRSVNARSSAELENQENRSATPAIPSTSPREPEYPEQPQQLDYIRRLSVQLSKDYRTAGRNRLRAIGIIGSDVKDKLLLLQALRTEFPDILFFTTDLDARLFHHRNFRFTRSLIVASSFGLSLQDCYQRSSGFASFRDSFQTSTYVACRLALTDDQKRASLEAVQSPELQGRLHELQVLRDLRTPRIFEIGREVAVCLNTAAHSSSSIHPTAVNPLRFDSWLLVLITVVSSLALVTYVFPPLRDRLSVFLYRSSRILRLRKRGELLRHERRKQEWEEKISSHRIKLQNGVVAFAVILFLVIGTAAAYSHIFGGELLSFYNGISSWPGIVLAALSLILSISFLIQTWYVLRHSDLKFAHVYRLEGGDAEIRRQARLFPISLWEPVANENGQNMGAMWRQYLAFSELANRVWRVGGMGVVFAIFWVAIFGLFGPANEPYRGELNAVIGRVVFNAALIAITLLTLFVVDATSLSLAFVRHISRHESDYSESTLGYFWQRYFTPHTIHTDPAKPPKVRGIEEFVDMCLIADQTSVVFQLITYPFISLTLLILSRSNFFDNYVWSMLILFVFAVLFCYVVWCAMMLQRAAGNTKSHSLAILRRRLDALKLADGGNTSQDVQVLNAAINQIDNMRQGAFAPLQENPLVRAILLPFGGTALVPVIDMVSRFL